MSPSELLAPLFWAAGVAGLLLAVGFCLPAKWRARSGVRRVTLWFPVFAGYAAGVWAIRGWPAIPPREAAGWLLYGSGAAVLGAALWPWKPPSPLLWLSRLTAVGVLLFLLLQPMFRHEWGGGEGFVWTGALGLAWMAVWGAWGRTALSQPIATWVVIGVLTGGLAAVVMIAGSATFSQNGLALAGAVAAFGVYYLAAVLTRGHSPGLPLALPGLVWPGLLTAGIFYADIPWLAAVLLGAAALGVLIPLAPRVRKLSPPVRLAAVAGWVAVLLAAALWWTQQQAPDLYY